MFPRKLQASRLAQQFAILLVVSMALSMVGNVYASDEDGSFGLTSFAFASYLGTGFYTTSGQNVFVLQMPFEHIINQKTDTDAGLTLKLPVTVGFINFDEIKIEEIPGLSDVGTITFLPGLEYHYPVTPDWTVIPFADYGFARELDSTSNVLITGAGIKSYYNVHFEDSMFTLGNRLLYAREQSKGTDSNADYSLIETGLNYRVNSSFLFDDEPIYTNLYYINFYYPDDLVFFEQTDNPIRIGVENEFGLTISNIPGFLFFENLEMGLGVRFGNDIKVYRLVFGAPF